MFVLCGCLVCFLMFCFLMASVVGVLCCFYCVFPVVFLVLFVFCSGVGLCVVVSGVCLLVLFLLFLDVFLMCFLMFPLMCFLVLVSVVCF